MKKVLSIVAILLLCTETQAQVIPSRNIIVKTQRQTGNIQWFLRAGLNIMNPNGNGAEVDSNTGYDVTLGHQKPMDGAGAYWGTEFGLGSRGFKIDEMKRTVHNTQYSPFTFGWKIGVAGNLNIDPYLDAFVSYDYTSKMKESGESVNRGDLADHPKMDCNHLDADINIDIGLWYDRFDLDFTYQRGFIDVFSDLDGVKTSNFMIRLGIAF